MKKPVYCVPQVILFFLFPMVFVLGGMVLILLHEYYYSILGFGLALLIGLMIFFGRKMILAKIFVDENGIKITYREQVVKQILWEEIKDAQALCVQGGQIVFAKDTYILSTQKLRLENQKKIFFIRLDQKSPANALYLYKDKIPVPIRDLDKLPKEIKEKLKQDL